VVWLRWPRRSASGRFWRRSAPLKTAGGGDNCKSVSVGADGHMTSPNSGMIRFTGLQANTTSDVVDAIEVVGSPRTVTSFRAAPPSRSLAAQPVAARGRPSRSGSVKRELPPGSPEHEPSPTGVTFTTDAGGRRRLQVRIDLHHLDRARAKHLRFDEKDVFCMWAAPKRPRSRRSRCRRCR
jgi:hypothetical protein